MKTKIINLIAQPSTGKSTVCSELFSKLKWMGYDSEIVPEYAKDLTWEKRAETLKNQRYIFGKQHHRAFRLNNQVEFIVTDCPLILNIQYERLYQDQPSKIFEELVLEEISKQDTLNILLTRTKKYNPNGRNQTEAESDQIGEELKKLLVETKQTYHEIPAVEYQTVLEICNLLRKEGLIDTDRFIKHCLISRCFDMDGGGTTYIPMSHSVINKTVIDLKLFNLGNGKIETCDLDLFLNKYKYA